MKKLWEQCCDDAIENLAKRMREYWKEFAETGNCNALSCEGCPFEDKSCGKIERQDMVKKLNENVGE